MTHLQVETLLLGLVLTPMACTEPLAESSERAVRSDAEERPHTDDADDRERTDTDETDDTEAADRGTLDETEDKSADDEASDGATSTDAADTGGLGADIGEADTSDGRAPVGDAPPLLAETADLHGASLLVEIPTGERAYVNLADAEQVQIEQALESTAWDLVFDDWNIFTNSGPSGPGQAAAFGPNEEENFLLGEEPAVPFMREDTPGGAFTNWYYYEGETHTLWSRYHAYGLDDGHNLYKLQILSYYGEAQGAPVSALYSLRYALVDDEGGGETIELSVDGTAGGAGSSEEKPSGCIDLSEEEVLMLTPEEMTRDERWDLCFRRDTITTNGGVAGPGGVTAVDLWADETADESLEDVQERTRESELRHFEAVDHEDLTDSDLAYQADGPISIFGQDWFESSDESVEPVRASWLVQAADGEERFLLVIDDIRVEDDGSRRIALLIRSVGDG